jgi:serine/threonine protein phosphatase PrpC
MILKTEPKDKSFNKTYIPISRSIDKMEKHRNNRNNESREEQISYEVICQSINIDDINNEKIHEKPIEKEIIKIEKLCKKGYSGDGKEKPNQDNYFIYNNFNNDSNNIYMGVCDGHGDYGHEISSFLVTNLPLVLGNFLRIFNIKDISLIDSETLLPIVANSCTQVNQNLYSEKNIDCNFSGTTCVSLIYTSKKVFCINIGDSRCIVGKFDGSNWKSENLSNDHKPQSVKEKERIIKSGGIIRQSVDAKGEFIGPQRVWVKDGDVPGLAMTRSFGDEIAHQIGVICEPEIIEYKLHEEDKFIILASDGIWEFMTNQECVDIVKDYYIIDNYKGAIKHLYQESCKRWLDEEDVIDDITLIIVFFK